MGTLPVSIVETAHFSVDSCRPVPQGLPCVTVAEAFRLAFDALVRGSGMTASAIGEMAGISSATMTRLKNGSRNPSFELLEQLRGALDVEPAALFDPDRALAQIGLARRLQKDPYVADSESCAEGTDEVSDGRPRETTQKGLNLEGFPDADLLHRLLGYWSAMPGSDARRELLHDAYKLCAPPSAQSAVRKNA
jgi:transcriptional regulator with XRE-family HTH domain